MYSKLLTIRKLDQLEFILSDLKNGYYLSLLGYFRKISIPELNLPKQKLIAIY